MSRGHSSHPIARAKERYGLDLLPADLAEIVDMVQQNRGKLCWYNKDGDGKSCWRLWFRDVHIRVVISPDFWRVVTFLPFHDQKHMPPLRRKVRIWKNGVAKWVDVDGGDVRG